MPRCLGVKHELARGWADQYSPVARQTILLYELDGFCSTYILQYIVFTVHRLLRPPNSQKPKVISHDHLRMRETCQFFISGEASSSSSCEMEVTISKCLGDKQTEGLVSDRKAVCGPGVLPSAKVRPWPKGSSMMPSLQLNTSKVHS
jgi:hypothetical protein